MRWEGCIVNVANVVAAVEEVVVGDAEDVPSSMVESLELVVVVMVQVTSVAPSRNKRNVYSGPWFLVQGLTLLVTDA